MELAELATSPPAPQQVVTPWADSRGQDLLGLRAPAERIAVKLMNGVTTISPLIRYLGFRSWVIHRYTDLRGPDDRNSFNAFAGKCEAALVLGHKLSGIPTLRMVGADRASEELTGSSNPSAKRLTKILAMDTYAGPSQDLGLALRRGSVPSLSKERGVPLAQEANRILGRLSALMGLDVSTAEQPLDRQQAMDLAAAFPISTPAGAEREMLIDAICPVRPRAGEYARVAAYCYLLQLAAGAGATLLDEDLVFESVIAGGGPSLPPVLLDVADGWLRFLVRDSLVAVHERAVAQVLGLLAEAPNRTAVADALTKQIEQLDPGPTLATLGLAGFGAGTPIRELCGAVDAACTNVRAQGGLRRWTGGIDEMAIIAALRDNPEVETIALLPVAWILADLRAGAGLSDAVLSIDAQSGSSIARLGLGEVLVPMVRAWRSSDEALGQVVAKLARRSIEQHLLIAWYRMQADPRRNVALLVSDGTTWTGESSLRPGRATSRLYQAISWLSQLGLVANEGITNDGRAVLARGLKSLEAAEVPR
ncbi:MAG TPA: hypothetical protein PKE29_02590 [Phycisphaerales bacterium]|nr:hypothetical protein [Phycisphaerales bacterium]